MSRDDRPLPDGLPDGGMSAHELPDVPLPDVPLPDGRWFAVILRDLQFWVPVVVLVAGLLVLRWITASQPA